MFNTILYLNKGNLEEYSSIINGHPNETVTRIQKNKSGKLGITDNIGVEANTEEERIISTNVNYEYFQFEKKVKEMYEGEYFFDCIEGEYEISTIPTNALIKMECNLSIPEKFDFTKIIDEYAPLILSSLEKGENYKATEEIINNREIKIPIIFENERIKLFSRIESKNLNTEYLKLEEMQEDDIVTIVGKIVKKRKNDVEIYDPLKDCFKLSRAIRRQVSTSSLINDHINLSPIILDEEIYEIELLTIYR